jgi:hypothetical protein
MFSAGVTARRQIKKSKYNMSLGVALRVAGTTRIPIHTHLRHHHPPHLATMQ